MIIKVERGSEPTQEPKKMGEQVKHVAPSSLSPSISPWTNCPDLAFTHASSTSKYSFITFPQSSITLLKSLWVKLNGQLHPIKTIAWREVGVIEGQTICSQGYGLLAGHRVHLIRPAASLWCERLSDHFDSPFLSQQEVPGDN